VSGRTVKLLDLTRQYEKIGEEIEGAALRVLRSGRYIGGEEVSSFEHEVAEYCGVKYAVGVSSGTDALLLSLMGIGVKAGDEVITSPFTFIATAETCLLLGAKPVFVDVDYETFNINPDLIEEKVTEKTKAIVPVHLFGQMADMDPILKIAKKYNIAVIEDAAQSIGASINGSPACSWGDMGCLSFFPSKNLGCCGDGGMVLTNNEELAKKIRMLREHGSEKKYHHTLVGTNARLDALQAAILRVKLKHVNEWAEARRRNAEFYNKNLTDRVGKPVEKNGFYHVYNQYTIVTDYRDELVRYLDEKGIQSAIYYPVALHLQEVFGSLGYREGDFPVSEELSRKVLSLPIYPELTPEEQEYVVSAVNEFFH